MINAPSSPGVFHTREQKSPLTALERRILLWVAPRLSTAVRSDHWSALGLVAMALGGLSFAAFPLTPWAGLGVVGSLALNWFGDSLDGTVARVRGQQRPRYGFYVDHVIDLAGTTMLLAGMAFSGLMTPAVA